MTPAALAAASVLAQGAAAGSPASERDLDWRLYRAAVSAADATLRLHETDLARHWLREAPAEHRGFEWRYLSAQAERSSARFEAQGATITDVAVSPDGRLLAAGTAPCACGLLRVPYTSGVFSVRWSRDGAELFALPVDDTVRVLRGAPQGE